MASGGEDINMTELHPDMHTLGDVFRDMCDHGYTKLFLRMVTDDCYGCQVNHPSQKNHPCLFMDEEDMKVYRERSLACMDFNKLYEDFSESMKRMDLEAKMPTKDALYKMFRQWYEEQEEAITRDDDEGIHADMTPEEDQPADASGHVRALIRDIVVNMVENTKETVV